MMNSKRAQNFLEKLPEYPPFDISFENIECTASNTIPSKLILRGVSGKFVSGQLTAILGPSGAGKSTLLNVLAGYKCDGTTGTILVNGQKRNVEKFRKISRYIMQEDRVHLYLTVFESMMVAANLKLGNHETRENKEIMINEILDLLRLTRCQNTKARGLSGGEKKRLSIALELLNNPPVLFLDEPTTGLDDVSCSQCIQLLKLLAKGGRTVVCAVHTPSAKLFSVFDNVYIVSQGQCVYQGYGPSVMPFLASLGLICPTSYSPADFMMEVCCKEYGDFQKRMVSAVENGHNTVYCKELQKSTDDIKILSEDGIEDVTYVDMEESGSSFFSQFMILSRRMCIQLWRDKSALRLNFCLYIFVSVLFGVTYMNMGNDGSKTLYNFGYFYVCIIVFMYFPLMPVLVSFPTEIKILKREHFNQWYNLGAYYLALTLTGLPIQLLLTFIYMATTYILTDQPLDTYRVINFYIVCILTALVAESIGVIIGSVCNIVNGLFVGTCVKIPMMLLATYGFGSGSETIPGWIRMCMYFSYLRYSMEGLMSTMLRNRSVIPCPEESEWCIYTDVSYFLRSMGMEDAVLWIDITALIFFLILFKATGFYLMKQRLSPNKFSRAISMVAKLVKSHFGP